MFIIKFLVVVFVTTQLANLLTTVYLHRGLAHRSVQFAKPFKIFCRFFLWMTTTIVRQEWVAVHRKHHAFSDKEGDPHSPHISGFWNIMLYNFFYYRREARKPGVVSKYCKDIAKDWFDRFSQNKLIPILLLLLTFVVLLGPIWGPIGVAAHFLTYVFLSATINAACHWFGYRNHDNKATNLWPVAMLSAGEGFHNNHHNRPGSAKLSNRWWEIDFGWIAIMILSRLGLAKVRVS